MGLYDEEMETIWFVSSSMGVISRLMSNGQTYTFKPDGTSSNSAWRIRYSQGRIFVVPGGRWASQHNTPGTVMSFEYGNWKNIDNNTIKNATYREGLDLVDRAVDPYRKSVVLGKSVSSSV